MKRTDYWLLFLRILKWIFVGDAVIFGFIAVGFGINTVVFLGHSVRTSGTVIALEEHEGDDGSVSYSPEFRFVAEDGSTREIHSDSSSNPPGFEVGDVVPVRYEKNHPSDARIATFWQTWPFETGSAIASIATGLIGLFFRSRVKKRKNRKPKLQQIQSLDQI